jgi:hypothetical protein
MSLDRPTIIRSFNDYFCEFMEDILRVLPNNKQIKAAERSFKTLIEMNKTILVKCWYKFVYCPYKDVIETGDIEFFFAKDYSTDLVKLSNAQKIMEIIDSVRQPAKEVCENEKNKEYMIAYIQGLCKLSKVFNQMDTA